MGRSGGVQRSAARQVGFVIQLVDSPKQDGTVFFIHMAILIEIARENVYRIPVRMAAQGGYVANLRVEFG
jgi:hypothetical protein